jgi:hypothetical protein
VGFTERSVLSRSGRATPTDRTLHDMALSIASYKGAVFGPIIRLSVRSAGFARTGREKRTPFVGTVKRSYDEVV